MNIVKLQNMLKSVPDSALMDYLQNPRGDVPSYLVLSEFQRRKDMRDNYKKQQVPETSVAEDLQKESQPSGLAMLAKNPTPRGAPTSEGVAGLPVNDSMYNEQNFAGGGIVAFADGGSTFDRYFGLPTPSRVREAATKSRFSPFMGGMGDIEAYQYADPNYLLKKREMLYKQLEVPGADKNAIYAEINAIDQKTRGPAGGYVPTQKPALTDAEVAAKNLLVQTDPNKQPMPQGGGVDSYMPKPLTVEEAMKQEQRAMELAGVDPNFYKTQAADLQAQIEALKGERSDAANMALLKAGFATMAGTSPFALVNLGKGAEAGVEQYGKDIKDIKAENRLLKQADMKLKEAQNAQQRGDAQSALKAIQEREKLIAEYNHYKMTTGATLEAAKIAAGTRTGLSQLPALYGQLNKAQQAGNQTLADEIQARIDAIEAGDTGGTSSSTAGWGNFKAVKPAK